MAQIEVFHKPVVISNLTTPYLRDYLIYVHADAIRAAVLRREADGAWPDQARTVEGGDVLNLASVELLLPIGGRVSHDAACHRCNRPSVTGPASSL